MIFKFHSFKSFTKLFKKKKKRKRDANFPSKDKIKTFLNKSPEIALIGRRLRIGRKRLLFQGGSFVFYQSGWRTGRREGKSDTCKEYKRLAGLLVGMSTRNIENILPGL